MLRIEIPADEYSGLTFARLEQVDIPSPANGFDSEINDNIILSFDDEQQAIDYAHAIDKYAESLKDDSSPEYQAAAMIIMAIGNDEFVQNYIQS
ncbi:MAG: hypothetical protein ACHQHN_01080 [Sphingobacteriales bacterium]